MSILKDGATYRFSNRAAENEVNGKGRSLNVYGNSPSSEANVCLWTSDDDDICQQWVYEASATEDRGYLRCKELGEEDEELYLDVYTGPGVSTVVGYNAHAYSISNTAYLEIEEISGGYVRIKSMYNGRYLTANQGSNGSSTGKDVNAAGNVYFYGGGLTDFSQDWLPVCLDGCDEPGVEPDDMPTKQYLIPPFPVTGVTADFGTDCEQIEAAQEVGYAVCEKYPHTFHYGIDLIGRNTNNSADRNIRSSGYGEVVFTRDPDYPESVALGRIILVKYPNAAYGSGSSKRNIYFLYCHLNSIEVNEGDMVYPGDVIGVSGSSGFGTDQIHLHLEAYTEEISISASEGGSIAAVDPTMYLFNKTSENDSFGYGEGTIVPDCDAPFYGAAYCDGTSIGCSHSENLYFYNRTKIRNRGDFADPTF